MRILIIEDNRRLNDSLRAILEEDGYAVDAAFDGPDGEEMGLTPVYDVIILDIMLPGKDGVEVCRSLRNQRITAPILMLTARDALDARVQGLDSGADDYLVKPFAFAELLARVRALVRRSRSDQLLRLAVADLVIDVSARTVLRAGRPIDLTTREYELLEYLVRHKGTLVSREMLARDVWGETERYTPLDNVIDVHMARLRKKVDQGAGVRLIHTVRGVGFIVREGE